MTVLACCATLLLLIVQEGFGQSSPSALPTYPRARFSTLGMRVELQVLAGVGTSGGDVVEILLSASDNKGYLSLGWSYGAMTGPLIACQYPQSTALATCVDLTGDKYKVKTKTQVSKVVVTNVSSGVVTIVLRTPVADLGITKSEGMRRVIFARGGSGSRSWKGDKPGNHEELWSQLGVDVYAGTFEIGGPTTNTYIALAVTSSGGLFLGVLGAALKAVHRRSSRMTSYAMKTFAWLVMAGSFAAVVIIAYDDFKPRWGVAPMARAIGAGACYVFSLLLFPTTRYINIGEFAGSSYDRFISWHVLGGIFVYLVVTVHFIWFLVVLSSKEGGNYPTLVGSMGQDSTIVCLVALGGWIILTIFSFIALFRSRMYSAFRKSHYAFILVFILFIVHYPPLGVCIIPGIVVWAIDNALQYYRPRSDKPRVVKLDIDIESKVVRLVVAVEGARWKGCHAGQYVFFSVREISPIAHPFTIAKVSPDGKQLTFYVRSAGSFTEELYNAAERSAKNIINQHEWFGSFTGPVGQTEVDLNYPTDVVLVGGGIGVTATLGLLHTLVERNEVATPLPPLQQQQQRDIEMQQLRSPPNPRPAPAALGTETCVASTRSITFIWSVREASLATMILPDIEQCVRTLRLNSVRPITVLVKIYITGNAALPRESSYPGFQVVQGSRPGVADMTPVETNGGVTAYFSCGPKALMETVRQAAGTHGALLHEEVFEF